MPAKKSAVKTIDVMDSKSLDLIKKARKAMRKLRKRSIKRPNTTALTYADRMIAIYDGVLDEQKTARSMQKTDSK